MKVLASPSWRDTVARLRYRAVLADEQNDCGPAALATVARYYGRLVDVPEIRRLARTRADGTDITDLCAAAQALGFEASCGHARQQGFEGLPLPAIIRVAERGSYHFVVLFHQGRSRCVVADPSRGVCVTSVTALQDAWSHQILLLRPSLTFASNGAGGGIRLLRTLAAVGAGTGGLALLSMLLASLVAALGYGSAYVVKIVVDLMTTGGTDGALFVWGLGLVALTVGRYCGSFARSLILITAGARLESSLALGYVRRLFRLPPEVLDRRLAGDLFARVFDSATIREAVVSSLLTTWLDVVCLAAGAIFMAFLNRGLTIAAFWSAPLVVAVWVVGLPSLFFWERDVRTRVGLMSDAFLEGVLCFRMIKAYSAESWMANRTATEYTDLEVSKRRREVVSAVVATATQGLTALAGASVLYVGGRQVLAGSATIGEVMFFNAVAGFVLVSLSQVGSGIAVLQAGLVALGRMRDIEQEACEPAEGGEDAAPVAGNDCLRLERLSFAYPGGGKVLHELTVRLAPDETVAIVGPTGCGKSTLACVMAGVYRPTSGRVFLGKVESCNASPQWWRRQVSIVFQDAGLLRASVTDNIALGGGFSERAIRQAARDAQAERFVDDLPHGFATELGGRGMSLSSGQRQRLALARAFVRDPAWLVLDEATANIDARTEGALFDGLLTHRRGRATVFITHRLSTAARADRILVIEGGRIVEDGSHGSLVRAGGMYQAMWEATFRNVREAENPAGLRRSLVEPQGLQIL